MRLFKKNDLILIGILIIGFLAILGIILVTDKKGAQVVVSVDSLEVERFPIDEDIVYEINGYEGGKNTLIIKDGEAYVVDSSCPDHLCENMGKISKVGQSVICLPNRVTVEIVGDPDEESEYDAIVGG